MASDVPTKARVVERFRAAVASDLAALAQVTADARSEATGAESHAEGKYDTRATEASYLAAGQGRRLAALKQLAAWLEHLESATIVEVAVGALVQLHDDRTERWVLVGPVGGPRVEVDGVTVSLISLQSPLGEELDGAEAGDLVEVDSPRGVREMTVRTVT
ncbi:MAG: GreA/GreB family elongation factor [Myxococcales bacterium]|nr:GreA/GreB family elongation factor [Myxococcales bacterium]